MENTTKKPRKSGVSPDISGNPPGMSPGMRREIAGDPAGMRRASIRKPAREIAGDPELKRGPLDVFFETIKRENRERNAFLRIKRVDGENEILVREGKVLLADYTGPEYIEKHYGGGRYVLYYFYGPVGDPRQDNLVRAVERFSIEGLAKEHLPEPVKPVYAAPQPQPYAPEQLAGQIAQAIGQSMAPILSAMAAAIERLHAPTAPVAPQPSLLDLTQALRNMQSLIPAPAPVAPAPPPVDTFAQLRDMMALAKEFTNPDGGESNPLGFLEKAIDKLGGPIIEHLQAERERGQQIPKQGANVQILTKNQLQKDLDVLLDFCARGEPAQNVVSIAINMIPEHMLPHLLNEPDPVSLLARYEPRVTQLPYQPWLVELFAYIREELSEDVDPDDQKKA